MQSNNRELTRRNCGILFQHTELIHSALCVLYAIWDRKHVDCIRVWQVDGRDLIWMEFVLCAVIITLFIFYWSIMRKWNYPFCGRKS